MSKKTKRNLIVPIIVVVIAAAIASVFLITPLRTTVLGLFCGDMPAPTATNIDTVYTISYLPDGSLNDEYTLGGGSINDERSYFSYMYKDFDSNLSLYQHTAEDDITLLSEDFVFVRKYYSNGTVYKYYTNEFMGDVSHVIQWVYDGYLFTLVDSGDKGPQTLMRYAGYLIADPHNSRNFD